MSDPKAVDIAKDLDASNLVIVGNKNGSGSDLVVIYDNTFKGKSYFHIRTVWQDDKGKWHPGKGLAIDPANAQSVIKTMHAAVNFC